MRRLVIRAGATVLILIGSHAWAVNCTSKGSEPCVCACDKLGKTAESEGRGTCRVTEAHENFCSLIWNRRNKDVAQAANELDHRITTGEYSIEGAKIVDQDAWKSFVKVRAANELSTDEAAVRRINTTHPAKYRVSVIKTALFVLIHAHVSALRSRFDIEPGFSVDASAVIWKNGDQIVKRMQKSKTQTQQLESYEVTTSFGCVSLEKNHLRVMIKAPFADAKKSTC